ncbi:MAG: glycosyltransferase family A protein [Acidimicrobiales bacterium]|nr:glycosyltransferase family A protein [Acidimicrobiales bacterium]
MPGNRPTIVAQADSASWDGAVPSVAALVATYGRQHYLPELLDALETQDLGRSDYEVVIVDNGSTDGTWDWLSERVAASSLRIRAVRLSHNRGPAAGRNHGADQVRAPVLVITDDDCIPTAQWLRGMRDSVLEGACVVQGAVHPDPVEVDSMGPWDHTKRIVRPTPFFETCNVAYRREAFVRAGGFDEDDPLLHPANGRAFGEDACLAWAVQAAGGAAGWNPTALVHHRCIASDFARWLEDQRQLEGFPGLARRSPLVAGWLHRGMFLNRRSERFCVAVLGCVLAVVTRRPWLVVAATPWLRGRVSDVRKRGGRVGESIRLLVRYGISDSVALTAMVRGSVRYRRPVL